MENTDNTLREMQQQMQQLREKLNKEQIINERLLQKSCRQTVDRLKFKSTCPSSSPSLPSCALPPI